MEWFVKVLKNYATFKGRARRKEYWMFTLFSIIISIVLTIIDVSIGTFSLEVGRGLFSTLFSLGVIIPTIAVGVRRMHDVNKSGWFLLIPIYNLILVCTEGDKGSNEYGTDPKLGEGDVKIDSDVLDADLFGN